MIRSPSTSFWVVTLGLLHACVAAAQPFPGTSVLPAWIPVVGSIAGAPDPFGTRTVVVNDPAGVPIAGALVTIDFSGCCDIALCTTPVAGQAMACPGSISGLTDAAGAFTFTALGAANDAGALVPPAVWDGCGFGGIVIVADDLVGSGPVVLGTASAFVLDQNGAAGGSLGTTVSDVANVLNLVGSVFLGAPYQARADLNADGVNSIADVAAQFQHLGRLSLAGGTGCAAPFCARPPCPIL